MFDFTKLPEDLSVAFTQAVDKYERYPENGRIGSDNLTICLVKMELLNDPFLQPIVTLMIELSEALELKWWPIYQRWMPEEYAIPWRNRGAQSGHYVNDAFQSHLPIIVVGDSPQFPAVSGGYEPLRGSSWAMEQVCTEMIFELHAPIEYVEPPKLKPGQTGKYYDHFYRTRKKRGL